MNIFVLDDDPTDERIPFFQEKLYQHTLYIAKDAYNANRKLQKIIDDVLKLDYIFLDHDLGGRVYISSDDEDCGMRVAEFISKNCEYFKDSKIIIHSCNEVGARNMACLLANNNLDCNIVPFWHLLNDLKVEE
jgi:hypothetical protein